MGSFRPVAIAVAICLALTTGTGFGSAQSTDSTKIARATPDVPDDEAFAGYQRVTTGITPPKATHSPDPEYPEIPPDADPRGIVVMLVELTLMDA